MPGPAKNNALNSAGVRLSKSAGKRIRSHTTTQRQIPSVTETDAFDLYISDLQAELDSLRTRVNILERKLNGFAVDPTTRAVTYPTP